MAVQPVSASLPSKPHMHVLFWAKASLAGLVLVLAPLIHLLLYTWVSPSLRPGTTRCHAATGAIHEGRRKWHCPGQSVGSALDSTISRMGTWDPESWPLSETTELPHGWAEI